MMAPKKTHLATSGGISASLLILELPIASKETSQVNIVIILIILIIFYCYKTFLPAVHKSAT
jgi:hypothetical protein